MICPTPALARSSPVRISATPGKDDASLVSIFFYNGRGVGASYKTGMQLALYIYIAGVLTFALDKIF